MLGAILIPRGFMYYVLYMYNFIIYLLLLLTIIKLCWPLLEVDEKSADFI